MVTSPGDNPGCLGFLWRLLGGDPLAETPNTLLETLPYRMREDFLSPAEASFYHVLRSAVGTTATICPKVRLADIFFVAGVSRSRAYFSYFNHIAQKHLDFLLCEPGTMKPVLGVELDDSSHARRERERRDLEVEKIFEAAHFPLLRVPVRQTYSVQDLAAQITEAAHGGRRPAATDGSASAADMTAPVCPTCGVPLVVRTVKRGERQGQRFFGCPNYPRCRETQPLT